MTHDLKSWPEFFKRMSGGHFDYSCFRISQFADELKHEIKNNSVKNEYGYAHEFSDKTIALLTTSQQIIEIAGMLAKEIERLYSSDHGEDSFADLATKILAGQKPKQITSHR